MHVNQKKRNPFFSTFSLPLFFLCCMNLSQNVPEMGRTTARIGSMQFCYFLLFFLSFLLFSLFFSSSSSSLAPIFCAGSENKHGAGLRNCFWPTSAVHTVFPCSRLPRKLCKLSCERKKSARVFFQIPTRAVKKKKHARGLFWIARRALLRIQISKGVDKLRNYFISFPRFTI